MVVVSKMVFNPVKMMVVVFYLVKVMVMTSIT